MRAFLLCLPIALFAQNALAAELVLYVFQDGSPLSGAEARLDGEQSETIPDSGRVQFDLNEGNHQLQLARGGSELHQMRFTSNANENADIILRLPSEKDGSVDAVVETYNPREALTEREGEATGQLSGRIRSQETGAAISGARITAAGSDTAATTGTDGRFNLELPRGVYNLEINHPEYGNRTLRQVRIVTSINQQVSYNLSLSGNGGQVEEVVATASYVPDTTSEQMRTSEGVLDVIGSEQIDAVGDSDAIGALKRVTGLSIQDGKFVSIRGQPERYTETTLNGSPLPSPDPIREIAPLDLFPTSILSSLSVSKSYDASQPGSFGAGLVDLQTLSAPDETYFEISAKTGGNSVSTGEEGLTYEGGNRDFLGMDDGTREITGGLASELDGSRGTSTELEEGAKAMPNVWATKDKTLPPDLGLSIAGGTNTEAFGAYVGINGTFGWSREYRHRDTLEQRFAVADDGLQLQDSQREERTDHDIDLSGFLSVSLDWVDHKLTSNTFLSRKTTERTEFRTGERTVSDSLEIQDLTLDWNERELIGEQLLGEHEFEAFSLDWRALLARAQRDNPDRRTYRRTRALDSGNDFRLTSREDATRTFIDTEDNVTSFGFDLERSVYSGDAFAVDLKGGASIDSQDRESSTRSLGLRVDPREVDTSAPIEEILAPEHISNGVRADDSSNQTDFYEGTADVEAAYIRADMDWANTVRLVGGLRQEGADYEVESLTTTDNPVTSGFDESDLLPSLSATWFFADQMQARVAFGSTISRPTLNEIGGNPETGIGVRYRDPDSNEQFQGNPDLKPAEIDSLDARWEWFPSQGELVTAGFFAKDYTNALEEELIPTTTGTLRRVVNAEEATVRGLEAEARLYLPTIMGGYDMSWDWAEMLYLQGNIALIDSEVTIGNTTRPLQGQADELVNLQVGYETGAHDLTVAANYTGERLASVVRDQPNTFEQARTLVDIKYDYRWNDNISVSAEIGNLLNEAVEETQSGRTFERYEPGVDFDIGMKYRF
ncbi:TonB-dependent receptor domain-containing protein [Halomonadaceae bacterium KBTZ08]